MSASELISRHPPPTTLHPPSHRTPSWSRTISYEESRRLVPWQTDNEFITTGYRRQLGWKGCGWSLVGYLHNETVNIHTHLLGSLYYFHLLLLLPSPSRPSNLHPLPPLRFGHASSLAIPHLPQHKISLALSIFLISAVGCLGLSAHFHAVQCRTKEVCERAHRGDYIGIIILIVGTMIPGLYFGFQGMPRLMGIYLTLITALGLGATWTVLSPKGRSHTTFRTLVFIGLGLSGILPLGHLALLKGAQEVWRGGVRELALGGGCYIIGAALYAARIPESLFPGRFNIFGSSHQIFHICVLTASWMHWTGLRKMAERAVVG